MNKGIKAALALGLCCVTAAGLFGCTKAAPEETTQPATVATRPAATTADTTVPESTTNASTDTTTKPAETTTKKAKEDSGSAYTVNQALDALTNYYGKGYDVGIAGGVVNGRGDIKLFLIHRSLLIQIH